MASAEEFFDEPVHQGPDYELAGHCCEENAFTVCVNCHKIAKCLHRYIYVYFWCFTLENDRFTP